MPAAADTCHATLFRHDMAAAPLLAFVHGGGCSSRYFEAPKPSPAALAQAAGFHVLLIDRPGHGQSGPAAAVRPILSSLPAIRKTIETVLATLPDCRDLAMIGHSIGGAVTLRLAADPGGLPLCGVAVSGIGDEPPAASVHWAQADALGPGREGMANTFFGAPGTYDWRGPAQLRRAAEEWNLEEVREMVRDWPAEWPGLAPRIALPVHYRLADQDGIWVSGLPVIERIVGALSHAPVVDAAPLVKGGHVYEFHLDGPELVHSQLRFLLRFSRR